MGPAEELSRYWIDGEQCSAVPYTRGANYDTVLCPTTTLALAVARATRQADFACARHLWAREI
jgi:hypothetical protein